MNQLFPQDEKHPAIPELLNGGWWHQHPELRIPGSANLDYALPGARRFVIDLLMELASNYPVDGLSLDFTRWPPVADVERHDCSVLTNFIKEIRQALDKVARAKGRKLELSAMVVEGHHSHMDLIEQKIDLEAWLASGYLDFICVESSDEPKFIALAKRYNIPYYSIQDNDSFTQYDDPEWRVDPHVDGWGEIGDAEDYDVVNMLDPTEYDAGLLKRYQMGADGVCLINNMWGWRSTGRLGHLEEMAERAQTGEVFGQRVGPKLTLL